MMRELGLMLSLGFLLFLFTSSSSPEQTYTLRGYAVTKDGRPVNGTAIGTIRETGESFATDIVDGFWELGFSVERGYGFSFGVYLNDTQDRIGFVHLRRLGPRRLSENASCVQIRLRVVGRVLFPGRTYSGELRIGVEDYVNTTNFTLGRFDVQLNPCLLKGEINLLELRAFVGRRLVGHQFRRFVV
jgi:hypothetical protein